MVEKENSTNSLDTWPSLGLIGTGILGSSVVTGTCTLDSPPQKWIVSPRNEAKSKALASKFSQVTIAKDNQ